ncbi:MAG: mRNA surveillance protein pelota [Candidatus Nezhaarchaeota archaeon]|nr:mRNA surveillance protein pelota [Candidatus Nezhaarchaeota archaeon]MCX8141395.1 mRNA surveillance protein pelota [Candidatus Nezhaarchaeota archaeon]MDW8049661.1 mRNA surveillance protein pelota [Nitrososphaerota archaeon]
MKVIEWDEKHGKMLLRVESQDDLWCLYNILEPGDSIIAKTSREVKVNDKSSRVPMTLKVRVEKVEFQPFTERLRIKGVVVEGPDRFGVVGAHHTISVSEGSEILVEKERWSRHNLKRIFKASSRRPVNILLIGIDSDEAAFVAPHDYGFELLAEVYMNLPGKHDPDKRDEALKERISELAAKTRELVERLNAKAIAIVGPGFMKESLAKEVSMSVKAKVYVDSTSSGGYQGVREAIRRGVLKRILRDLNVVEEAELMDEFLTHLSKSDGKAVYGVNDVKRAAECGAIEKLLVHDELIRSPDLNLRREIERLIDLAERTGAQVKIFSSLEEPSQQLKSIGGLAAILRFSLYIES